MFSVVGGQWRTMIKTDVAVLYTCSSSEWGDSRGGVWGVWERHRQMGPVSESGRIRHLRQLLGHHRLRDHWHGLLLLWSLLRELLRQIRSGDMVFFSGASCVNFFVRSAQVITRFVGI